MSGFDWLIVVVIALSVLSAVAQGFFFELFAMGGLIVGYLLASWEYWRLSPWFEPYVRSQQVANAAGFMTVFFSVCILAGIAGKVTRWAAKEVGLRWVDRLLGGAFGLARGLLLVSVGVLAIATFAPDSHWLADSVLGRYFLVTARSASWLTPSDMQQKFRHGIDQFRKMQSVKPASATGGLATPDAQSADNTQK